MGKRAIFLAMGLGLLVTGCSGAVSSPGDDCTSHYRQVARAPTLSSLKRRLLASEVLPTTRSITVAGEHNGRTVINLVNGRQHTIMEVDVWRRDPGGWTAGQWLQCTD